MTYWCDNSPVWTHYANASSILFPAWERAFAVVIQHHLPNVQDPELKARMAQFMEEELAHANAHEAFNGRYELRGGEATEFRRAKVVHRKPGLPFWLGAMVSIEHLAACMSRSVLGRWGNRSGRDYKLFCWHAKEELGHKNLAFDLWRHLGYNESDLRKIARTNQIYVLRFMLGYTIKNVRKDGVFWRLSTLKDLFVWSAFVTTKVLIPALLIYLPGFHPNNIDDSKYLANG